MRNTLQYPITKEEIVEALNRISDEIHAKGLIGDMRPLLLREAVKLVESSNYQGDSGLIASMQEAVAHAEGETTDVKITNV